MTERRECVHLAKKESILEVVLAAYRDQDVWTCSIRPAPMYQCLEVRIGEGRMIVSEGEMRLAAEAILKMAGYDFVITKSVDRA